jgi:uncharacterized protein
MLALPEVQSRFYAEMLSSDDGSFAQLLRGEASSTRRRLEAYRRNMFTNLTASLALTYPVVESIVGGPFFRELARSYVRVEPSTSGDLNDYGASFADFIAAYPHAVDLAYLPDVARLEWQIQRLDLAADSTATGSDAPFAALASTPADRYDALYFEVDPVVVRLNSDWPLAEIWRVNQAGFSGDMQVDFSRGCQLLLWRTPHGVEQGSLDRVEAAFLDELIAGKALAPAVSLAMEIDENFDLGACLQRWIAANILRGALFDPHRC